MRREDFARRAAELFRDYGYRFEQLSNDGRCLVASRAIFSGLGFNQVKRFQSTTAALDHFCPIIGDKDFTRRMIQISKAD